MSAQCLCHHCGEFLPPQTTVAETSRGWSYNKVGFVRDIFSYRPSLCVIKATTIIVWVTLPQKSHKFNILYAFPSAMSFSFTNVLLYCRLGEQVIESVD